jgi:hypothetical protein
MRSDIKEQSREKELEYYDHLLQDRPGGFVYDVTRAVDEFRDQMWERSRFEEREHTARGITYKSRYILGDFTEGKRYIQVNAYDSAGNRIGQVDLYSTPAKPEVAKTSWPRVAEVNQRQGIASEIYKELPSIAKSYGFTSHRSEFGRTGAGEALWRSLALGGHARPLFNLMTPASNALAHDMWLRGGTKPSYYEMDWSLAKDVHAPKGWYSPFGDPVGVDNNFSWTPFTREQIPEGMLGPLEPFGEGEGRHNIYDSQHPNAPQAGHLVHNNKYYRYNNINELNKMYTHLRFKAEAEMRQHDPIRASLDAAAERLIYDTAYREFGRRDIANFNREQLQRLYARFAFELNKAAEAAPKNNPQVVLQEASKEVQEHAAANPMFAGNVERGKQLGVDITQVSAEHQIHQNTVETRPSFGSVLGKVWNIVRGRGGEAAGGAMGNVADDPNSIPGQIFTPEEQYEHEPVEGAAASFGVQPNIVRMLRTAREANVAKVKTARVNSSRFITDELERGARLSSERRASDRTRVGRRDIRTYSERLSDERMDDLLTALERKMYGNDSTEGGVNFEKPLSGFLFYWGDRAKLGAEHPNVVKRIAANIRKLANNRNLTYSQMDRASDMLGRDLIQLAKIGATRADGRIHVFKSNEYFGNPSIWQTRLTTEVEQHEIRLLEHILSEHQPALTMMKNFVQGQLFPKRNASYGIEEWIKWNRAIDDAMRGMITPETAQELGPEIEARRAAAVRAAGTTQTATPTPRPRRSRRSPQEPPQGVPN